MYVTLMSLLKAHLKKTLLKNYLEYSKKMSNKYSMARFPEEVVHNSKT